MRGTGIGFMMDAVQDRVRRLEPAGRGRIGLEAGLGRASEWLLALAAGGLVLLNLLVVTGAG